MDSIDIIELVILFVLLLLSAFFSSCETAFSSVTKVKARAMLDEGKRHAKTIVYITENFERMLSTVLIGNNIVNLSASALATTFTMKLFGNVYVSVATGILTLLVLIFGEIVPKTAARRYYEAIAIIYAPIIRTLMTVLHPLVFVVDKLAAGILKLFGQNLKADDSITESELRTYVDVSREDGVIEKDEHLMINNVFDFSDSVAKDVMIPRIDLVSVEVNATYEEIFGKFKESMYTRIPVYDNENSNMIGFINMKDFMFVDSGNTDNFSVKKLLREAYFTYEYKKTNDLMLEMRKAGVSIAFVVSEYGDTVGMITMEDLLEEIVGEIRDEYDADEDNFIVEENDGYMILANVKLEDINDAIGTEFTSEDYDSIGGLVLDAIDRLPNDHEKVTLEDGTELTVCGIKQNRIMKVFVKLPEVRNGEDDDKNEENKSESVEA